MPEAWDSYEEVEHKTAGDYGRASVCASKIDLMRRFPVRDKGHPALYWDLLASTQRGRSTKALDLGAIQGTKIVEIVHRMEEPIDYVKILTFKARRSDLLCPFLTIAEWNVQLEYAPSKLIERDGSRIIETSMIERAAARYPQQRIVEFTLEHGLPKALTTPEEPSP
jgi:hypothetical protein